MLRRSPGGVTALLVFLFAGVGTALNLQTLLSSELTATSLLTSGTWKSTVEFLGGAIQTSPEGWTASLEFFPLLLWVGGLMIVFWSLGAFWISRKHKIPYSQSALRWGYWGWVWFLLPLLWELLHLICFGLGWEFLEGVLLLSPPFWMATAFAGWAATFCTLLITPSEQVQQLPRERDSYRLALPVWIAGALFVLIFLTMNVQLYRGLWIPHGDSGMYEEHLWNLTHGKGFRSYLDQGLFLGEHIQVIHLFLIPLHLIWPSHLLLETAETLAIASGCIPVFWLTHRHTGSKSAGSLLAAAYLLYFPLQFLDIAIDLKTFRPIAFGIPLMLFAFDQWERGRIKTTILLLVLALSAKEDYCLVIAPWGLWIALTDKSHRRFGWLTLFLTTGYLLFVTRIAIPWFRSGEELHYVRYFDEFGNSPGEIVWNMLTRPSLLWNALVTYKTVHYLLCILVPIAWLPLLSPTRFLVGVPILGLLCLNQIAEDPRHHFHAPLIPILFWAAAAGLGNLPRIQSWVAQRRKQSDPKQPSAPETAAPLAFLSRFAVTSALATCFFFSISPLGLAFWSPDSHTYWRKLYIPGPRAEEFPKVFEQIPLSARVASTDFVHTRFTHHERSYDYSNYARKVSGYKLTVPEDTDYIVIDTQHPYSEIKSPQDIREYREHPEEWELLPDTTDGFFIVLKRRK